VKWKNLIVSVYFVVPAFAQKAYTTEPVKAACGPPSEVFNVKTQPSVGEVPPQAGKALIYILEVQDRVAVCLSNCGSTVKVGLDSQWVGATRGTSHLSIQVEPGEHHLCVAWQSKLSGLKQHLQLTDLHAKAGETLYFRVHVVPPTAETISQFGLEPVNVDEGRLLVHSSPQSTW
jgi:hypothetical protein